MKTLIDPQKLFFQEFILSHDLLLKLGVANANCSLGQSLSIQPGSFAQCTLQILEIWHKIRSSSVDCSLPR